MYAGSNPVLTSQQNIRFVSAIGAAVARFPDTEEVTGSIPVSRTKENPLALRLRGFVFNFLVSLFAEGRCSSADLCLFWRRCSVYFLRAVAGNPPSLRCGERLYDTLRALPENTLTPLRVPDVTTEGTIPPPACKTLSSSSVKGLGLCARYRHNELMGEGLSPSQPFAGSAKPVL